MTGFTPAQFRALTGAQLGAFSIADIHALSSAQLGSLSGVQIAGFSAAQINALSPTQLGGLNFNYNSMLALYRCRGRHDGRQVRRASGSLLRPIV